MSPLCKHKAEYGENVVLPDEVSLEHFDQCFTPEQRFEAWQWMRRATATASRCLIEDHLGAWNALVHAGLQIEILRHELSRKPARSATRTAYRARARRRTRSHR